MRTLTKILDEIVKYFPWHRWMYPSLYTHSPVHPHPRSEGR